RLAVGGDRSLGMVASADAEIHRVLGQFRAFAAEPFLLLLPVGKGGEHTFARRPVGAFEHEGGVHDTTFSHRKSPLGREICRSRRCARAWNGVARGSIASQGSTLPSRACRSVRTRSFTFARCRIVPAPRGAVSRRGAIGPWAWPGRCPRAAPWRAGGS